MSKGTPTIAASKGFLAQEKDSELYGIWGRRKKVLTPEYRGIGGAVVTEEDMSMFLILYVISSYANVFMGLPNIECTSIYPSCVIFHLCKFFLEPKCAYLVNPLYYDIIMVYFLYV